MLLKITGKLVSMPSQAHKAVKGKGGGTMKKGGQGAVKNGGADECLHEVVGEGHTTHCRKTVP